MEKVNSVGHTLIGEAEQSLADLAREKPAGIKLSDGTVIKAEDFPEPPVNPSRPDPNEIRPGNLPDWRYHFHRP